MIVVDTNVIAYLYLKGDRTAQSEALLKADPDWVSSVMWRSEFRSVLFSYLRKKIIPLELAFAIMEEAENQMAGMEYQVPSGLILSLSLGSRLSAYDCEFVALAKDLSAPLITADAQILKEFPSIAVSIEKYLR